MATEPVLQVALDFNELSRALKAARQAVGGRSNSRSPTAFNLERRAP